MEGLVSSSRTVKQTTIRKINSSNSTTDLWFISRQGSLAELDATLSSLKKYGGNIDSRNAFGLTPLHIATWRNHVPIVKRLLAAGADPNARDGESGWSSLHRALHFGHLAVASVLLQSGASLTLEDSKCRIPADLLSGPVSQIVGNTPDSVATEVYSWGSGTNYQLGTGNAHIQKLPCKVALQGSYIRTISASKFHSVAVGSSGELYTWGFGRGGRLGHPDFDIHSGQAAVITPRQVTLGLGFRPVKSIAAAKHHTVIATESGEVFTWGSNREGQLGYTSVDTQPTPRRVSSLKARVIAVAAANKHTVAVAESGEIFTWGCNKEGQLGYGTSNSASNYIPRMVEYLKGKVFKGVSAAKYHTIALGADGEVFTWGHRLVTPRRVSIARSLKKSGSAPLKFHCMERLHVISVAAGVAYSTALTDDGALFYWASSDPNLRSQQMYSMGGRNIVSISAGKYWTAAATITGDVYMWDAKRCKDDTPTMTRLHGVKRATSVCVGETHLLVVSALYHPPKLDASHQEPILEGNDELEDLDEGVLFDDIQTDSRQPTIQHFEHAPSLKSLCERVAADSLVEPRNAIQLLEIADSLEADDLRKYCEEIALRNLDYIFTVSAPAIVSASPEILVRLEKLWYAKSSEPWSYRHLPTPTATFPAIWDDGPSLGFRDSHETCVFKTCGDTRAECFSVRESAADQAVCKQVRAVRKKLQQIEMLEAKQFSGHILDDQQISKLQTRSVLECMLAELGAPSPGSCDGKGNKKTDASRKQRNKSKQKKSSQIEAQAGSHDVGNLHISKEKEVEDVKSVHESEIIVGKQKKSQIEAQVGSLHISKEKEIEDESGIIVGSTPSSPKSVFNSHESKTSTKKRNKKGGLSMFLSGALDAVPKAAPPPPPPKTEGPAWGGTKVTKEPTSLRDIQNEQTKTREVAVSKDRTDDLVEPVLSSPMPSTEGEKCTPRWSSTGTSPVLHRPYLRDIQLQQVKKQQSLSHSPKTRTSGFSVASTQGSASDSGGQKDSRWFKPETDTPSSIRSIQIEEKAMKDLKRFYSNVKLVKSPHPQA